MAIKKKGFQWTETIKVEKTTDEQYLDIDESLIELEKNEELVRLDMNTIEYPIFSKDTRRKINEIKKYNFKSDGSSYLKVEAPFSKSVPGEFEERVFIALTKIMRNNGYGRSFFVTPGEIMKSLNLEYKGAYVKKLKDAIELLSRTVYIFKNTLYSNKESGVIEDKVNATIMSIRILTRKDKESEDLDYFEDGRIKEVYKISFTDYFYDNIVTKGYLVFDSNKLLGMKNSITRSMYTMMEKWRGYNLYIKKPAFFIARRIPLSWEKAHISRTVKNIEKSFIELKGMGLIKDYNLIKNGKWELAHFEVFFTENHNKLKRESFFKEKGDYGDMDTICITHVEKNIKEMIDNIPVNEVIDLEHSEKTDKKSELKVKKTKEPKYIEEIYKLLPPKARELKTLRVFIEKALLNHDLIYILGTADYVRSKKTTSIMGYFKSSLENNYAEEHILKNKAKFEKIIDRLEGKTKKPKDLKEKEKKIEKSKDNAKTRSLEDKEKLTYYFNSLDEKVKNEILEEAKSLLKKKNPEVDGLAKNILKVTLSNCSEKYDVIEKRMNTKIDVEEYSEQLDEPKETFYVKEEYSTLSKFMLEVITFIKENGLSINIESFVTLFNLLKEYDDEFVCIRYDEESKIGIIKKKSEGGVR